MGTVSRRIESMSDALAGIQWVSEMVRRGLEAGPVVVTLGRPKRTLDQNAKLHAMITDVARQVGWYGKKRSVAAWKAMFSASLRKQETVPNLQEDGFVVFGSPTSEMTVKELSDLVEIIYAFGAERGVVWSEP